MGTNQKKEPARRGLRLSRDTLLVIFGVLVAVNELFVQASPRPEGLAFAAALIGVVPVLRRNGL